jgi:hypothetical protein
MNHPSSTDTSYSPPSSDAISRRAYEIWEREGRPDGCDLRHWLEAEQELGSNRQQNSPREEESARSSPNTDVRPLQGTRAGAAANREPKRGSNAPFTGEKSSVSNGNSQAAARRRPANAPPL